MNSYGQTFSEKVCDGSYLPPSGLAAAITAHLAYEMMCNALNMMMVYTCKDVTIPALDTDMLCCSMAS